MSVNFTGKWNLDLLKSKSIGPPPRSISVTITHSDPDLLQEMLVTRADGQEQRAIFQCRTNGEQNKSVLNGKSIRGSASWRGKELAIESWMQIGEREIFFCDFWSLSADGRVLSMEHRHDALAGQLAVLERSDEHH
jgi:hypothetical protein